MKIYIVTSGCYSDYTISQVFLDRKKADAYVKLQNSSSLFRDYRVETYETSDDSFETPTFNAQIVATVSISPKDTKDRDKGYNVLESSCNTYILSSDMAKQHPKEEIFFVGPNDSEIGLYYLSVIRSFPEKPIPKDKKKDKKFKESSLYATEKEKTLKIAYDLAYQILEQQQISTPNSDFIPCAHAVGVGCMLEDYSEYMFMTYDCESLEDQERYIR